MLFFVLFPRMERTEERKERMEKEEVEALKCVKFEARSDRSNWMNEEDTISNFVLFSSKVSQPPISRFHPLFMKSMGKSQAHHFSSLNCSCIEKNWSF